MPNKLINSVKKTEWHNLLSFIQANKSFVSVQEQFILVATTFLLETPLSHEQGDWQKKHI